jgi:hypothetical protein
LRSLVAQAPEMNIDVRPLILKDHAVRLRGLRNG